MVGTTADTSKAEELFSKLDENSDGEISQEEFINIIKKDHELLNVLQKNSYVCKNLFKKKQYIKSEFGVYRIK